MVLLIVVLLPFALELGTDVQELAGAALAACVLQAGAYWTIRRRREAARQAVIAEIRGLLRDRINNHLQVVLFSLTEGPGRGRPDDDRERLAQAIAAVAAVSRTLEELSSDSLRRWKARYASSLGGATARDGSAGLSGPGGSAGER